MKNVNTALELKLEKMRIKNAIEEKEQDMKEHLNQLNPLHNFMSKGKKIGEELRETRKSVAIDAGVNLVMKKIIGSRMGPLQPILMPYITRAASNKMHEYDFRPPLLKVLKWVAKITEEKNPPILLEKSSSYLVPAATPRHTNAEEIAFPVDKAAYY